MPNRLSICALLFLFVPFGFAAEPIHDWSMREGQWTGNRVAIKGVKQLAEAKKLPEFVDNGIRLNGDNRIVLPGVGGAQLPTKAISVEAWVSIDQGLQWGGILSYSQDNGSYEKGWLLGYNQNRFGFCVSSGPKLNYVYSKTTFEPDAWFHVVGTYDGAVQHLYVNGKLESSSSATKGPIAYPPSAYYVLGSYKDKDEEYPMTGAIREARLYDRALRAEEVAKLASKGGIEVTQPHTFEALPAATFLRPGVAEIVWTCGNKGASTVHYGKTRRFGLTAFAVGTGPRFRATLKDLEPNTAYYYKIKSSMIGGKFTSKTFVLDTAFNYTVPPVRPDGGAGPKLEPFAKEILAATNIRKGFCLVYGLTDGSLAYALAKNSELNVVCVDTHPETVAKARTYLYEKGVYGSRVSVMQIDSFERLPFTSCFANLIVSESSLSAAGPIGSAQEVFRLLKPGRGTAVIQSGSGDEFVGWSGTSPEPFMIMKKSPSYIRAKLTRSALKGSGEWTHQYGNAANTASTGEALGGAKSTDDLALQWIGRPGGNFGIDRQPRMPAPLSVNGRLFHQGMNRLVALDSHNGSILWGMEIPELRRLNMPRDAGNWCADDERLYLVVKDKAWVMNAEDGTRTGVYSLPPGESESAEWGFIAVDDESLFGSRVKSGSTYTKFWGKGAWFDAKTGAAGTEKICSDSFFAYGKDGRKKWVYEKGMILNTTISLGEGKVFFVESRHPKVKELNTGRIGSAELWKQQFLVALDAKTGRVEWEKPIDTEDGVLVFYMQYSPHGLIVTSSHKQYHLYNFSPKNGSLKWSQVSAWSSNHHSGHIQHPVVLGSTLFLQPNGFDLRNGNQIESRVGAREGCTTYIGSTGALIYRGRGRNVSMWDPESGKVSHWNRLRPSCWLNMITAGGMLQIPEGGAGCSCGNWIETSLSFGPKELLENE